MNQGFLIYRYSFELSAMETVTNVEKLDLSTESGVAGADAGGLDPEKVFHSPPHPPYAFSETALELPAGGGASPVVTGSPGSKPSAEPPVENASRPSVAPAPPSSGVPNSSYIPLNITKDDSAAIAEVSESAEGDSDSSSEGSDNNADWVNTKKYSYLEYRANQGTFIVFACSISLLFLGYPRYYGGQGVAPILQACEVSAAAAQAVGRCA